MLKKTSKFIITFVLGFVIVFSAPAFVLAARNVEFKGLVPVCNTIVDSQGNFSDPCDFDMVLAIVNKVIDFLLVTIATPLFALILIYVGWIYLSAGGNPEAVTRAKHIFKNVIIGYIIALASWLIVKTILSVVGFEGDSFLN